MATRDDLVQQTYQEFENQYKFIQTFGKQKYDELLKNHQDINKDDIVNHAFSAAQESKPYKDSQLRLDKLLTRLLSLELQPRADLQPELSDEMKAAQRVKPRDTLLPPWTKNFEPSVSPSNKQAVSQDPWQNTRDAINAERNENKLKNKPSLTPGFQNTLRKALENDMKERLKLAVDHKFVPPKLNPMGR